MTYLAMIGPEYDNGNLGAFCGQSLVEHAGHTVQETNVALAAWKKWKLEQIKEQQKEQDTSTTNDHKKDKDIELISVNSGNNVATSGSELKAELSSADIMSWGKKDKNEE